MRRFFSIGFRLFALILVGCLFYILIGSSLDIYNTFAYDRAILRESPYGRTPLLTNPNDYQSYDGIINSGEYVYVTDWLSVYNGKIVFSKVKTGLREGYVNRELLVETNINIVPVLSVLLLSSLLVLIFFITFKKIHHLTIVQS